MKPQSRWTAFISSQHLSHLRHFPFTRLCGSAALRLCALRLCLCLDRCEWRRRAVVGSEDSEEKRTTNERTNGTAPFQRDPLKRWKERARSTASGERARVERRGRRRRRRHQRPTYRQACFSSRLVNLQSSEKVALGPSLGLSSGPSKAQFIWIHTRSKGESPFSNNVT